MLSCIVVAVVQYSALISSAMLFDAVICYPTLNYDTLPYAMLRSVCNVRLTYENKIEMRFQKIMLQFNDYLLIRINITVKTLK